VIRLRSARAALGALCLLAELRSAGEETTALSPERARQVANGILTVAGVALAVVVWRQPALRRVVRQLVPVALREIRPVHVAAVIAALAAPPAAVTAAAATASKRPEPDQGDDRSATA
jgi:hypothetical protein